MHTDKKVTNTSTVDGSTDKETSSGPLKIHFQDNTTHTADAVIGADGIHGYVRTHILGPSHPALKPKFGGFWDSRSLIPMEKAKQLLGEEYFIEGD
jgi:salicylate hydroxylase